MQNEKARKTRRVDEHFKTKSLTLRFPPPPHTAGHLPPSTAPQLPRTEGLLFEEIESKGPWLGAAEGKSEKAYHTEKREIERKSTS